jgi:hypothetical protein
MYKTRALPPRPAKVTGGVTDWPEQGRVKAIVKVQHAGHVPERVTLRSRIDEQMFTCEFDVGDLEHIAADPLVESIAASEIVPAIGAKPPVPPGAGKGG